MWPESDYFNIGMILYIVVVAVIKLFIVYIYMIRIEDFHDLNDKAQSTTNSLITSCAHVSFKEKRGATLSSSSLFTRFSFN